jgi:hypothetical protein
MIRRFVIAGSLLLLCLVSTPKRSFSANVLTVNKTPYEQFVLNVDFSQVVGSDAFTLDAIVAKDRKTLADATGDLIAPSSPVPGIIPMTAKVEFALKGGVSGATYIVGVRVIDSVTSEKFEGEITVAVR